MFVGSAALAKVDILYAEVGPTTLIDSMDIPPTEMTATSGFAQKRRREYLLGRSLARQLCREIGAEPGPGIGAERGRPTWPPGAVGSISHSSGHVCAAVAPRSRVTHIGVDLEVDRPLPAPVRERVLNPGESWLSGGSNWYTCFDRLAFSAKESFYKAMPPERQRELRYRSVSIHAETEGWSRNLRIHIHDRGLRGHLDSLGTLHAWWSSSGQLLRTFVCITAGAEPPKLKQLEQRRRSG